VTGEGVNSLRMGLTRPSSARCLAFAAAAVAVGSAVLMAGSTQQRSDPQGPASDVVAVRGCVVAGAFTTASRAGVTTERATYRLTGPRGLLKQLRHDHEGHFEEITGRMSGESAGQTVRKKKVGKVAVIVGAGRGVSESSTEETFDPPSIEVASFRHLDDRCPG
jgi:hypothetical protein